MPAHWSRIHAALGLKPTELTYKHILDAVDQSIAETDDLDFKQALPPSEDRKLTEFAKDIAAMANTRGGLIVFGATEANERITGISGVPNSESERQRLSNIAATRISPMVPGLDLFALQGNDEELGLLVVSVPASPDAPHLIGFDNKIGIPFRDGSNTRWMRERDLERAYRDRFSRRASDEAALRDQRAELIDQLDMSEGCWIVITSRPTTSIPTIGRNPTKDDVVKTIIDTLRLTSPTQEGANSKISILRELDNGARNPRIGLRRWVTQPNQFGGPIEQSKWVHIEMHHDGSTSFAVSIEAWSQGLSEEETQLHTKLIESAIIDAVTLAAIHARNVGVDGMIGIEVALARHVDSSKPIVPIGNRTHGAFISGTEVVPGSRAVRNFKPVYGQVSVSADASDIEASERSLREDTLNQFGVQPKL